MQYKQEIYQTALFAVQVLFLFPAVLVVSCAIFPISFVTPDAIAIATALPVVTWVPAYTMLCRSASDLFSAMREIDFATGEDSPVSAASEVVKLEHSISLASAGTASPELKIRISPGTICRASIISSLPFRIMP